jgi:hypothetical protein
MKICIPEKLDLDWLEEEARPEEHIKHYKRDKLAYILHLINYVRTNDKRLRYANQFVPLSTKLLQKQGIHNYKDYITLLEQAGVIEIYRSYVVGGKSMEYRLKDCYATGIVPYEIQDSTFARRLSIEFIKLQKGKRNYPYLKKWFNPKLEINSEVARNFLQEELRIKQAYPYLQDEDEEGIKDPSAQYNSACVNLIRFENKDYDFFTVDRFGRRFYSILTNTPGILRNALSYDGKQLISIDISNSQPFFSILLFRKAFWVEMSQKRNFRKVISQILRNNKFNNLSIMLETIEETLGMPDVQRFTDLVCKGEFYKYFEQEYIKATGKCHRDKKELKSEMFLVLYSENGYIHKPGSEGKDLFKQLFPNVYNLFQIIKNGNRRLLPQLLQMIESDMILNEVCGCISRNYGITIFTIHDSIATTSEHVQLVKTAMCERISAKMGVIPPLKEETWEVSNLDKELSRLHSLIGEPDTNIVL